MTNYLYNHTSPETAYVVNDYPWGFRLRTTIRYWIESKEGHGQRFCSQTINPKTGSWCAPKKSTYCNIAIMFLDENQHVKYEELNLYASLDDLKEFKDTHFENLDQFQKDQLRMLVAKEKIMQNVTCTVVRGSLSEEDRKEQEQIKSKIINAIQNEYVRMGT